jgi:hypothetical protein
MGFVTEQQRQCPSGRYWHREHGCIEDVWVSIQLYQQLKPERASIYCTVPVEQVQ